MSKRQVFDWHKWFSEGREDFHDDSWLGQPTTAKIYDCAEKVQQLVCIDQRMIIRMTAEELGMEK